MPIDRLLPLLRNVRKTGAGRWIASAPTRSDSNPSVSLRELPDGRLLLHDHGGDSPADILAAIGLSLADLFPKRLNSPAERRAYRLQKSAHDSLKTISEEVWIVVAIAHDVKNHKSIDDATWRRLVAATAQISTALTAAT